MSLAMLVAFGSAGNSHGSDVSARIADLLYGSLANATARAVNADGQRVLWAAGAGALPDSAEASEPSSSAASSSQQHAGRRLAPGGKAGGARSGGAAAGGGGARAAVGRGRAAAAAVPAEPEALRGDMPRWKQDMLKNKTQTAWKKWLEKDAASTPAERSQGYRGKGTEVSSESGDVWKECGGMPRSSDTLKHTPNLGTLPK